MSETLLIGPGNAQIPQVRPQPESGQQLLLHKDLHVRGQHRVETDIGAVCSLALVVPYNLQAASRWERLLIGKIAQNRVLVDDRDAVERLVGQRLRQV